MRDATGELVERYVCGLAICPGHVDRCGCIVLSVDLIDDKVPFRGVAFVVAQRLGANRLGCRGVEFPGDGDEDGRVETVSGGTSDFDRCRRHPWRRREGERIVVRTHGVLLGGEVRRSVRAGRQVGLDRVRSEARRVVGDRDGASRVIHGRRRAKVTVCRRHALLRVGRRVGAGVAGEQGQETQDEHGDEADENRGLPTFWVWVTQASPDLVMHGESLQESSSSGQRPGFSNWSHDKLIRYSPNKLVVTPAEPCKTCVLT